MTKDRCDADEARPGKIGQFLNTPTGQASDNIALPPRKDAKLSLMNPNLPVQVRDHLNL